MSNLYGIERSKLCTCGTVARQVINGSNDRLNYWYCDTCKDVAGEKTKPVAVPYFNPLILNNQVPPQQPQPIGPLIPPTYWVKGYNFKLSSDSSVLVPADSPCDQFGHRGPEAAYGIFSFCNCRQVKY